jgi:hypothetical protein
LEIEPRKSARNQDIPVLGGGPKIKQALFWNGTLIALAIGF